MATEAAKAVEAILMVAQEPVDPHLLAQVLEISPASVDELCLELQAGYAAEDRGFVLVKVAGGYRFQSHGDLAPYVERFVLEGQSARLSSAALETLAIVAYKQPLSRAQVASIRGVNVDGVMRTLEQRGYVEVVGRDAGPGQASLFGTTTEFLERLGLDRVEDLPPIAALFPSTDVMEALERGLRADRPAPPEPAPVADPLPLVPAPPAPTAPTVPPAEPADSEPDVGTATAPSAAAVEPAPTETEPETAPPAPVVDLWADDEDHDDLEPPSFDDPAPAPAVDDPAPDPAPGPAPDPGPDQDGDGRGDAPVAP